MQGGAHKRIRSGHGSIADFITAHTRHWQPDEPATCAPHTVTRCRLRAGPRSEIAPEAAARFTGSFSKADCAIFEKYSRYITAGARSVELK